MCRYGNKDDCAIKNVKKIIRSIIGGILLMYVCLIMLLNIPFIQKSIGSWVADALSEQTQSNVRIGNIDLGLLNHIIIDDFAIDDQQNQPLIKADRLATKIEILPLLQGKISISSTQIFGLKAQINRATPDAPTNIQFLADILSPENDDKESKPIDLRLGTFVLRRGHITYDVKSEPSKTGFDTNHLDIDNIDATLSLKAFTTDCIDLTIRRLNLCELNSNINIKNIQARLAANPTTAQVTNLCIQALQSEINIDTLNASFPTYKQDKAFEFSAPSVTADILPAGLAPILPQAINATTPLHLKAQLNGTSETIYINQLDIVADDGSIAMTTSGDIQNWQKNNPDILLTTDINLDNQGKKMCMSIIAPGKEVPEILKRLGEMEYAGQISKYGSQIATNGQLTTDAGNADIDITADGKDISVEFDSEALNLALLTSNSDLGHANIQFDFDGNIQHERPEGRLSAIIKNLEYKGQKYTELTVSASRENNLTKANAQITDPLINALLDATYTESNSHLEGNATINDLNPHAMNLTKQFADETFDMNIAADIHGTDINKIIGQLNISDLNIHSAEQTQTLNSLTLNIQQAEKEKQIALHTDFADATLSGDIQIDGIIDAFKNQAARHLPALIPLKGNNTNRFDFDVSINESDFIKHFITTDYKFEQPIHASGHIDALADNMQVSIDIPQITNGNKTYINTHISSTNTQQLLSLSANTIQKNEDGDMHITLTADAINNELQTLLHWENRENDNDNGMLYATTAFSDSLGQVKSNISLKKSQIMINDTLWQVQPSTISVFGKQIQCNNVRINNDKQSITLNGTISENPDDSLVADLRSLEVAYITELVDFHAVRFRGAASGRAVISNIYEDLHLNADITVDNMHLQEGRLGTGHIQASWDQELKGIRVDGHIVDNYKNIDRVTDVNGFIAPSQNDIDLKITTHNTNAEFLNGFLSSTFKNINGNTNGILHVVGPLNDVNLIGNISADVQMTLRATNVTYKINPLDSIHLRQYGFDFNNVRLTDDRLGNAVVNGTLAHRNMKNFKYDFDIRMNNLTVYDEREFNSDKFYATVYADGNLQIHGSDGHPLRMSAEVTPTRGSVFAYDAATPDAITSSGFVTFRDVTSTNNADNSSNNNEANSMITAFDHEYQSDIYMDLSLHVNPNCEIMLRMDNKDDGYMTTRGSGTLTAHYHNKSPFSLNGIYQIQEGHYKLYLQELVSRDLVLQPGSNVVFNGNPFDANIHLICHHTLNSVPLRDLTYTDAFNQNTKVKVVCVMDITGKLDNMNFAFAIELPTVSDETRQLVNSLITSDEELNMQMIYLLGLGRFYPSEYARANGETGSDQAVNTLLSSTISGQINQMLSNVISEDSKWNFGTGLSTGERGWNDLDVEGILSGRLFNDRLLINGNFGYRDNALTNSSNFIGDFDVRWRLKEDGHTFIKAYNQTNDRYFTKATLNTQGIGVTYQRDFDSWKALFRRKMKEENEKQANDSNKKQKTKKSNIRNIE